LALLAKGGKTQAILIENSGLPSRNSERLWLENCFASAFTAFRRDNLRPLLWKAGCEPKPAGSASSQPAYAFRYGATSFALASLRAKDGGR